MNAPEKGPTEAETILLGIGKALICLLIVLAGVAALLLPYLF